MKYRGILKNLWHSLGYVLNGNIIMKNKKIWRWIVAKGLSCLQKKILTCAYEGRLRKEAEDYKFSEQCFSDTSAPIILAAYYGYNIILILKKKYFNDKKYKMDLEIVLRAFVRLENRGLISREDLDEVNLTFEGEQITKCLVEKRENLERDAGNHIKNLELLLAEIAAIKNSNGGKKAIKKDGEEEPKVVEVQGKVKINKYGDIEGNIKEEEIEFNVELDPFQRKLSTPNDDGSTWSGLEDADIE